MLDFSENQSIIISVRGREKVLQRAKNFEKKLKKPLTNRSNSDIINTNKGNDTLQTRKELPP
jgi:hypothetical protein